MEQGPLTVDVIDAIYTTGAQRRLKPDPIPESVIWAVLDAAIHGPSGGNSQRWAWVVITDPDTKRLVGEWYLDAWNSLGLGRRAKVQKVIHRLTGPAHGDAGPTEHHKGDCNYRTPSRPTGAGPDPPGVSDVRRVLRDSRRQPVDAVTYWERWGEQRARVNGGSSATN